MQSHTPNRVGADHFIQAFKVVSDGEVHSSYQRHNISAFLVVACKNFSSGGVVNLMHNHVDTKIHDTFLKFQGARFMIAVWDCVRRCG